MELRLYLCEEADNVINKVKTNRTSLDIYLKRDVDISSPQLILLADNDTAFNEFNYAEIPLLKRFYFITSTNNIGGNRWELRLDCDVLETYKDDIINSNARYKRNIQNGDYFDANLDTAVNQTIETFESNKSLPEGSSMILTTVGVGA